MWVTGRLIEVGSTRIVATVISLFHLFGGLSSPFGQLLSSLVIIESIESAMN
jgi:hypothetical protein